MLNVTPIPAAGLFPVPATRCDYAEDAIRARLLAGYLEGWAKADPVKIAGATTPGYSFDDPFVGTFSILALPRYFEALRSRADLGALSGRAQRALSRRGILRPIWGLTRWRCNMKRLRAFAAILACLVMPALAIVPDQGDWTVVTIAPDGAWGSATELSVGEALAKAIANCKAMSGAKIGCGYQSRAIQGGWILATRCGDRNILVAERRLADAERAARERETDLREHYAPDLPRCRRVLTVNPHGGVIVARL
jgi:hypothetical protein